MAMTTKPKPPEPPPMPDPAAELARLHDDRTALLPRLLRAQALVNPLQRGEPRGPVATRLEQLEAPDTVAHLEGELRRLDIALLRAEEAVNDRKRRRRADLLLQVDAEVRAEFAALVAATDDLAAQWAAFAAKNRTRDTALIATTPVDAYCVGRYGPLGFAPLAGDPTLGCQWVVFRDALARDWS